MAQKLAEELQPGDTVVLASSRGLARVLSCNSSVSTPINPRRGGSSAIALIAVFQVVDGPYRGETEHAFVHPKDVILCR